MEHRALLSRLEAAFAKTVCFGPVVEYAVLATERRLGIDFPASYREFVLAFGASFGPSLEIAGLPAEPGESTDGPTWSSVLADTLAARKAIGPSLPLAYVAISHDGSDTAFYIDTSAVEANGEGPVVALGPGRPCEEVASSFLEFAERIASR